MMVSIETRVQLTSSYIKWRGNTTVQLWVFNIAVQAMLGIHMEALV